MHLDARLPGVPARLVRPRIEREVRAELAIDPREDVFVEGRRDPLRVIVRGHEDGRILDQVQAEQEPVARRELPPHPAQ